MAEVSAFEHEIIKTIQQENVDTRARLQRIADSTDHATTKRSEWARKEIQKQDDAFKQRQAQFGFSKKRLQRLDELNAAVTRQNEKVEASKAALEELGLKAEDNKEFQQEQKKLLQLQMRQGQVGGSAAAEDEAKQKLRDMKGNTFLKKISTGITGILAGTKEKLKGGLDGFKKFAFGALAVAALAFLNSPKFDEIKKTIMDVIIPLLADLYDYILKPLALYLGGKIKTLLEDMKAFVDGEKGLGAVIWDNIGTIGLIVAALAPKLLFGALWTAVKGIGTALLWVSAKTGLTALITAKLVAIKGAFAAKLVALKAFLVPLLPIIAIAAGISLVLYSLKQAFDDFMFELEATGSVWEAVKTGIMSFYSNLFGFPLNLIKDGVSWILEKIGNAFGLDSFVNASKALDDFSFVDLFKEGMEWMGNWISGMFDATVNWLKEKGRSLLKMVGLSSDFLGTKEEDEAKDAAKKREKEEREKEYQRKREELKAKKKLEEEAKLLETKKKQEAMMAPATATSAAMTTYSGAYGNMGMGAPIINAPVSNRSTNTSNHVSTSSTSLINQDRIFDKLSFVG